MCRRAVLVGVSVAGVFATPIGAVAQAKKDLTTTRVAERAGISVGTLYQFAVEMMCAAMAGATRYVLEAGASPAMIRGLREHLVVLCQS